MMQLGSHPGRRSPELAPTTCWAQRLDPSRCQAKEARFLFQGRPGRPWPRPHHGCFPLLLNFNFEVGGGSLWRSSAEALLLELKSPKHAFATLKLFGHNEYGWMVASYEYGGGSGWGCLADGSLLKINPW